MLTVRDAKVIAGEILVEKYGLDFVRENIEKRLFTGSIDLENAYQIDFELFEEDISKSSVITPDGFSNPDDIFPDTILSVVVDKQSGEARVMN